MSGTPSVSLLSGRAQDRLLQLQRALNAELRTLNSQQSLLLGALQACDLGTQSSLLQEYLQRVEVVLDIVARLQAFVRRASNRSNPFADDSGNGVTAE